VNTSLTFPLPVPEHTQDAVSQLAPKSREFPQVNYRVGSPKKGANGKPGNDSDSESDGSDFEGAESASSEDDAKLPGKPNDQRKGGNSANNLVPGLQYPPGGAKAAAGAHNSGAKFPAGPIISLAKGSHAAGAMFWHADFNVEKYPPSLQSMHAAGQAQFTAQVILKPLLDPPSHLSPIVDKFLALVEGQID
jgi:hypothetical protein